MHPLRGYDSLSLDDLLQGTAPARLYPLDIQNTADGPYDAAPTPMVPRGRSGLTQEKFLALKQAMRRIAPHVPPDVLQRHYINRLAELSNPTVDTLYPAPARRDMPAESGGMSGQIISIPRPLPAAHGDITGPFVNAAMAHAANQLNRHDAPLSFDTARQSIQPYHLAAPAIEITNPELSGDEETNELRAAANDDLLAPSSFANMSTNRFGSSVRRVPDTSNSHNTGAVAGAALGRGAGSWLGSIVGAAGGTAVEPGGGTLAGGAIGRAGGGALGSWIGRNVGSALETAILSMSRPSTGTPGRNYPPKRRKKSRYEKECAEKYKDDLRRCDMVPLTHGSYEARRVCQSAAFQRWVQCEKGGIGAITTPLLSLETPYPARFPGIDISDE